MKGNANTAHLLLAIMFLPGLETALRYAAMALLSPTSVTMETEGVVMAVRTTALSKKAGTVKLMMTGFQNVKLMGQLLCLLTQFIRLQEVIL